MRHVYHPRGAADKLFDRTDREILINGPSGTGKSRACSELMVARALSHRNFRGLIVRKTAKSLTTSAIRLMKRDVLPELIMGSQVEFRNGNRQDPPRYEFGNGSTIDVDGMDDSHKILGGKYDMVYAMNATDLDLDDWEDLLLTLQGDAMGYTQIVACCLPQHPTHWLKLRCDSGKTAMLDSRHEDNPRLFARVGGEFAITDFGAEFFARLNDLTGVRKLRNKEGRWAVAEGLILPMFDPAIHMVRPFDVPHDWGRIWGVDFGFKNPFCWGNWVRTPDGVLIEFQEIYMTGRTVQEHVETILRVTRDQPRPEKIVCDHDAGERALMEKALSREWGFDVTTVSAKKNVKNGIEALQKRLKRRDLAVMHGALVERDHQLVKMQYPTCGVEEVPAYVWSDVLQEQPVKKYDHWCDQARYVVMEEDSVSGARVRMRR